jgi:hypothetical protein
MENIDNSNDWFEKWKQDTLTEEQRNNLIKPIEIHEDGNVPLTKPVYNMEQTINGELRFAITSLTDGGKYVRGNMLYYRFNGVNIYTDMNNIIFVNRETNTLFIREYDKVQSELNPTNPQEKQYIILFTEVGGDDGDGEFPFRWEACQGRNDAYDHIKVNAPLIDIDKSIIIVEDVAIKDCLTVREFVNHLKNSNMVDLYDGFEIDEYYGSDAF